MNERQPAGAEATHAAPQHRYDGADEAEPTDAVFPWPPPPGVSFAAAAVATWRESVFHPASFFRRMPPVAPVGPVLVYLVAAAIAAAGIQLFWEMMSLVTGLGLAGTPFWPGTRPEPASALLSFFFAPLLALALLGLAAGIAHGVLALLGGATNGFGATIRVCAFGYGPQLFVIVPVLGQPVGIVWSIAITVIGLREAHATTGGKAAFAVLAPLGCLGVVLVALAILLAVGAAVMPGW